MPDSSPPGRPLRTVALAAAVLLTRLPWLGPGFGADPDAWRLARSARTLANEGVYVPSRPPGYPVVELLLAPVVGWGPEATNGVIALLSVVAAVLFARILEEVGGRHPYAVAFAFALVPVVYVNSVATMDYLPALTLVLAATLAVLRDRPGSAGVLLGLAVGARITSGAMLLPLALWHRLRRGPGAGSGAARMTAATLGVGALCFAPVVLGSGTDGVTFADAPVYPTLRAVVVRATTGVWGTAGVVALAAGALTTLLRPAALRRRLSDMVVRRTLTVAAVVVVLYLAAFVRLPLASGYLIPAVPFVLAAVAVAFDGRGVRIVCAGLIVASFVTVGRSGVTLRGEVVADHSVRTGQIATVEAALARLDDLPAGSNVVAGWWFPALQLSLGHRPDERVAASEGRISTFTVDRGPDGGDGVTVVMEVPSDAALRALRGDATTLWVLPGVVEQHRSVFGVDLAAAGARPLLGEGR